MKSFSKYISEVAQPRERGAEEEQAFKDQHTYEVIPHPVALDTQFTGDIQKPQAMRPADNKGDHTYDKAYAANVTGFEEFDESVEQMEENRRPGYVAGDDEIGDKPKPTSIKSITTTKRNPFKGKLKPAANRRPGYVAGDDEIGESNNLVDESMMDNIKKKANDMRRKVVGPNQAEKDAAKKKQMAKQHASTMKNIGSAMGAVAKKDKAAEVARLKQGLKNVENQRKESLEEGPFKGIGKILMKHKLNKIKSAARDHQDSAENVPLGRGFSDAGDKKLDGLRKAREAERRADAASNRLNRDKNKNEDVVAETTQSALMKPVTTTTPDGKKRTVMKTIKNNRTDDNGQDIIKSESGVNPLVKAVTGGKQKIKEALKDSILESLAQADIKETE